MLCWLLVMQVMIVVHTYVGTLNSCQAICEVRNFSLALHNSPLQCAQSCYSAYLLTIDQQSGVILSCVKVYCMYRYKVGMGLAIRALVQVPHFNLCCVLWSYRMMTVIHQRHGGGVKSSTTLWLGQVRWQAPLTPPYIIISISYADTTFQRSPNTHRLFHKYYIPKCRQMQ